MSPGVGGDLSLRSAVRCRTATSIRRGWSVGRSVGRPRSCVMDLRRGLSAAAAEGDGKVDVGDDRAEAEQERDRRASGSSGEPSGQADGQDERQGQEQTDHGWSDGEQGGDGLLATGPAMAEQQQTSPTIVPTPGAMKLPSPMRSTAAISRPPHGDGPTTRGGSLASARRARRRRWTATAIEAMTASSPRTGGSQAGPGRPPEQVVLLVGAGGGTSTRVPDDVAMETAPMDVWQLSPVTTSPASSTSPGPPGVTRVARSLSRRVHRDDIHSSATPTSHPTIGTKDPTVGVTTAAVSSPVPAGAYDEGTAASTSSDAKATISSGSPSRSSSVRTAASSAAAPAARAPSGCSRISLSSSSRRSAGRR